MKIPFYKYHGTGNDFILIDNRNHIFDIHNHTLIKKMCDRHFGIGADGLIVLSPSDQYDFTMHYFNADGHESTMCGNGGRCVVSFAQKLGLIGKKTSFKAIDGVHTAYIENAIISLQMADVHKIEKHESHLFLDTGSPHHVSLIDGIDVFPVYEKGKEIRYAAPYYDKGSNVDFVEQINENTFKVRTYERGVEDETLSCGTGVTAVAISMYEMHKTNSKNIQLHTLGGVLEVSFEAKNNTYKNIYLKGPAHLVFEGTYYED